MDVKRYGEMVCVLVCQSEHMDKRSRYGLCFSLHSIFDMRDFTSSVKNTKRNKGTIDSRLCYLLLLYR